VKVNGLVMKLRGFFSQLEAFEARAGLQPG